MLFFLVLMGFSVYTTLLSGVIRKSKYGYIGGIRASSQSVSYEVVFSIFIIIFIFHTYKFGLFSDFFERMLFLFLLYLIMVLSELNRAPFDFSEGERELVSGYNVEFSSVAFVLLFLSEYGSLIFFCCLGSFIFFNNSIYFLFVIFSIIIFIRSSYPRFRYDFLMRIFWFKVLPVILIIL